MQVLPRILPINELKNTANISKICKESETPIVITKNGYSDMVLMSVELYEQTIAKMQAAILINEALNDPERNKEKVELDSSGRTVNVMTAGYYNVNIKDIDKITDCKYMFWYNDHLESVPYFNTCKVTNMENMFSNCRNLNSVEMLDTSRVNNMYNMFYGSDYLNHETIQRWSTVYDFENNKMKEK